MRESLRDTLNHLGRLIVTGGLAAGILFVLLRYGGERQVGHAQSVPPGADAAQRVALTTENESLAAEALSRAFRRAAQKVLPAVVVIKAGPSPVCPRCGRAHDEDEGKTSEAEDDDGHQKALDVLGSGFIVSPSGVVLTNKHVVKDNPKLVVQTADGRQHPGRLVSTDREYDAAVIQIESNGPLPFVRLGDSAAAEIGDWVLTIGSPLKLDQTVSAGIISAKNRSFCSTHQAKYLQTDAVVNPGSSGGPLVTLNGEVIGIATAIASEDGGYQGIGFAIPVNLVKKLVAEATRPDKEPAGRDLPEGT